LFLKARALAAGMVQHALLTAVSPSARFKDCRALAVPVHRWRSQPGSPRATVLAVLAAYSGEARPLGEAVRDAAVRQHATFRGKM